MGVIKRGILGGVSGSVGSVVGTSWKGIAVLKSKPLSVANPRTTAQVEQRDKMSLIVLLSQAILASWIKPLWDRFAQGMSGYNDFVSKNIQYIDPVTQIATTWNQIKMSIGKLTPTETTSTGVGVGDNAILVEFPTTSTGNQASTDECFVMVIVNDFDRVYVNSGNTRASGSQLISIGDPLVSGDEVYVYSAFKSRDGRLVSNSFANKYTA